MFAKEKCIYSAFIKYILSSTFNGNLKMIFSHNHLTLSTCQSKRRCKEIVLFINFSEAKMRRTYPKNMSSTFISLLKKLFMT